MAKFILSTLLLSCISLQLVAQHRGCSTIEQGVRVNFHKNSSDSTKSRGLADNYFLWDLGKVIKVKFLNGSKALQNKIKPIAREWEKYANIKFNFVTSGDADIRVMIGGSGSGHWSYIGTYVNSIDKNEQTLNLDSSDIGNDDSFLKTVVLHEFGHSIGLLHEHSSPISGIKWNKEKMYEEYAKMGWTEEDVDFQVFSTYKKSYTNGTKYDNKSIMHYPINPGETLDGYLVDWNKQLSQGDISLIAALYPKTGKRKLEVTRINIQNFKGITLEGNEVKQGISLFPSFDLKTGSKGGRVKMIFKFYDEEGYGFKDEDGTYEENGVVSTMRTVLLPPNKVIQYNQNNKKDFEFFLPIEQIPADALDQNIIVTFKIVFETSEGEIKNLYQSQPLQFKYLKK
jgi:hypothetical protein